MKMFDDLGVQHGYFVNDHVLSVFPCIQLMFLQLPHSLSIRCFNRNRRSAVDYRAADFDGSAASCGRDDQLLPTTIPSKPCTYGLNQCALPRSPCSEHRHQQLRLLRWVISEGVIADYSKGAGLLSVETEISNDGNYVRLGVGQKDVRLNVVVLQTLDCVFVFQLYIFQELSDDFCVHYFKYRRAAGLFVEVETHGIGG